MTDNVDRMSDAGAAADAVLGDTEPPFRPPVEPASEPAEESTVKEREAVAEPSDHR